MNRQLAEQAFQLGDRVRLSPLGKDRVRRPTTEIGTVVGLVNNRSPGTVRVLFDGLKTAKTLHKTYVEPLPLGPTNKAPL
jgi:hypothetical protein